MGPSPSPNPGSLLLMYDIIYSCPHCNVLLLSPAVCLLPEYHGLDLAWCCPQSSSHFPGLESASGALSLLSLVGVFCTLICHWAFLGLYLEMPYSPAFFWSLCIAMFTWEGPCHLSGYMPMTVLLAWGISFISWYVPPNPSHTLTWHHFVGQYLAWKLY